MDGIRIRRPDAHAMRCQVVVADAIKSPHAPIGVPYTRRPPMEVVQRDLQGKTQVKKNQLRSLATYLRALGPQWFRGRKRMWPHQCPQKECCRPSGDNLEHAHCFVLGAHAIAGAMGPPEPNL